MLLIREFDEVGNITDFVRIYQQSYAAYQSHCKRHETP